MRKNIGLMVGTFLLPLGAFAQEAAASGAGPFVGPAAAIGIALAVFGAALAQGKIAGSYMDGASRNPGAEKVMKTPLILSLAFVESLVLFTVLIVFMLINKM